jgi:flagellar biosynthetic protein FliR
MEFYLSTFYVFILILARVTSLFAVAPVFGHPALPFQLKIWLSLFISYILLMIQDVKSIDLNLELIGFFLLVIKEVMVGLVIGIASWTIFSAVRYAGNLMGLGIGLSASSMLDPENSKPVPVIGQIKYALAILIFLMLNGHHFILQTLKLSYDVVPFSRFGISDGFLDSSIKMVSFIFIAGFKISAPAIVAFFLTDIANGVLSRVFPQMNVFMFAFAVKIFVGFFVLITTVPFFTFIFKKLLVTFEDSLIEILKNIRV